MPRVYEVTKTRQSQIVDAAGKIIIEYGSEHVTIKKIAQEVGISEAAIYRHFKSKSDILSLLIDHIEENLVGDMTKGADEGATPLELLDGVLRSHLSEVQQRQGISFQVFAEVVSLGDKNLNMKVSQVIDRYIGRLKTILAKAVKSKEVSQHIDLDAAAAVLFCIVHGIVNIWTLNAYSFDLQERYAALWKVFRQAITKQ